MNSKEKLISEAIKPIFEDDVAAIVVGEPVVPSSLVWRGTSYPVLRVLATDKGHGPCSHLSGEHYLRKHWYRIETTDGLILRVYFERRPRQGGKPMNRWYLYSVEATR